MPHGPDGFGPPRRRTWRTMARWERKAWHRDNALRELRGLPAKARP
jgi:hypothetical protein